MNRPLKIGDQFEARIDTLSFTGKGICRFENFVVFANGAIPGDLVRLEVFKVKRRHADAKILEIIEKSPQAIEPECPHFEICGGCSFQNYPYELQLKAKQEAVLGHLERIARLKEPPLKDIIPCDKKLFYRNKMEFSFIPDNENFLKLGLHYRGEWGKIFDVTNCMLQSEKTNQIISNIRDFFIEKQVPAYHPAEHNGYLRFLIVRTSEASGEIMIILVTGKGDFEHKREFIDMITSDFPEIVSVFHVINATKSNIAVGKLEGHLFGKEYITEQIDNKKYQISPTSFFQTNSTQVAKLYSIIADLGEFKPDENLLDLYTGCGTIAIYLADRVKSIVGIELNPEAIQSAEINAEINQIDNCRFLAGDVRKILLEFIEKGESIDSIVIDPPRAGIGTKVTKKVIKLNPRKIVYVSCNPSTLASDLADFKVAGYQIDSVIPVDMFPHTFHIESVTRLTKIERDH